MILFSLTVLKKTTKNAALFVVFLSLPFFLIHKNTPDKTVIFEGEGVFRTFFTINTGTHYVSKGKFLKFQTKNSRRTYKNIPCFAFFKTKPPRNRDYILSGKLKYTANKQSYVLHNISLIRETTSIPGLRAQQIIRNKIFNYISDKYPNIKVSSFLSGICLGKKPILDIREHFQSLGLSHLLAISGFHFSLASNLMMLMTFMLNKRKQAVILMIMITVFMLIQLPSPSVIRSWIAMLLMLSGRFIEGKCSGINRLSFAFIVITGCVPSSFSSFSLQFSFMATLGIVFFFNFLKATFSTKQSSFSLSKKIQSLPLRTFYFLFDGVALNISVYLFLWPLLLKYCSVLPLSGFFYNLFSSLAIYVSVICLIFGALTRWDTIHAFNELWCRYILNLTEKPTLILKEIYFENGLPATITFFYLMSLMIAGVLIHNTRTRKENEWNLFCTI